MIQNAYFENLCRLGKEHAAMYKAHEAKKAFRAWYWGTTEELEMDEFLWDREVEGFVDTLRKAGLPSFVYTNQSTAVMENIHQFVAAGCTLEGPCTLTKKSNRWGEETEEQVLGLRFRL